jgi:DNA-binding NarL/FixJ family response regulator
MTGEVFLVIVLMTMRVLIVDDQPVFCRQLSELLSRADIEVVGEAVDIPSAQNIALAEQPDLAIVDIMLPGMHGIEGVPCLKMCAPQMRILLVSAYLDPFELLKESALSVGAEAFIPKEELDLQTVMSLLENWEGPSEEA